MSRRYLMDCQGYSCGICYKPIGIGDLYVTDHGALYHATCAEDALAVDPVANWWGMA
ncbi:hypothetical protein [Candidatus Methanocrinis natronophilus]|uniref:Uncharacterized protein n=1 Tax=Candidatus Methanocrinis natronophilus TaxID=3033396 RepID=A0ABT5XB57_9EURY|nr:hypothetical protein [Candidatus Methanocrinis natronophilus]MDF0591941.1 hypothetical protein [Candidatus Methanocrinis natronophilus]